MILKSAFLIFLKKIFCDIVNKRNICCLPSGKEYNFEDLIIYGKPVTRRLLGIVFPVITRIDEKKQKFSYLNETLVSLLRQIDKDSMVQVFIGDEKEENINFILYTVFQRFKRSIQKGALSVIQIKNISYNIPKYLPGTLFNDTKERIIWRSRHNLINSFMLSYSSLLFDYILETEDDAVAVRDMVYRVKQHIEACRDIKWYHLKFTYYFGNIGDLYPSYMASKYGQYLRTFYLEQPCDMLRYYFFKEFPNSETSFDYGCPKIKLTKSLFKHIGKKSSLKENWVRP